MDTMTYLALKVYWITKNRIIGMGGAFRQLVLEHICLALDKPANDISAMVIGGHGDTTMIPLTRLASQWNSSFSIFSEKRQSSCRYYGWWTLQDFLEHQLGMLQGFSCFFGSIFE
jgi:malate dehydrogenase